MEAMPLVMEPESRFYADGPVVVLDFQSLYPSQIIAYNLCFRWRPQLHCCLCPLPAGTRHRQPCCYSTHLVGAAVRHGLRAAQPVHPKSTQA